MFDHIKYYQTGKRIFSANLNQQLKRKLYLTGGKEINIS